MKTLYVRNVPEALHAKLKKLAARNRRSLGAEVVTLMDRALKQESSLRKRRAVLDRIERRLKGYVAPPDAMDSVDMLRQDRER
ncbi:MAG: Arc family DNA-binding protein [Armatimonadota bacterium]